MKILLLLITLPQLFLKNIPKTEKRAICTCLSYDLKEQLEGSELIAHATVLRIDTVKLAPSYFCVHQGMRESMYERGYEIEKIVFKIESVLKGIVNSDTFSVLSKNDCNYQFATNREYIVSAHYEEFCELEKTSDSIKCNDKKLLCTSDCCGNTLYYNGAKDLYQGFIK